MFKVDDKVKYVKDTNSSYTKNQFYEVVKVFPTFFEDETSKNTA